MEWLYRYSSLDRYSSYKCSPSPITRFVIHGKCLELTFLTSIFCSFPSEALITPVRQRRAPGWPGLSGMACDLQIVSLAHHLLVPTVLPLKHQAEPFSFAQALSLVFKACFSWLGRCYFMMALFLCFTIVLFYFCTMP